MSKPTAAFVLLLIGGILIVIGGFVVVAVGGLIPIPLIGGLVAILGILGIVCGVLVIVGAVMVNSGEPGKVKTGSILGLIFGILSLFVAVGGFFIGFILCLVGGVLGLAWKPEAPTQPAPTQQAPA
jgi:MFS family permease